MLPGLDMCIFADPALPITTAGGELLMYYCVEIHIRKVLLFANFTFVSTKDNLIRTRLRSPFVFGFHTGTLPLTYVYISLFVCLY